MKLPKFRPADTDAGASDLSAEKSQAAQTGELTKNQDVSEPLFLWLRNEWLMGFFLIAITILAYQPVWGAGYIWDDDTFLTNNPVIKSADGLRRIWFSAALPDYFPLTSSMFWLEWRSLVDNPRVIIWSMSFCTRLSAVLLWRVLARLKIPGALAGGGHLRAASGQCRIGGMDHRAQKHAVHVFLCRHVAGLAEIRGWRRSGDGMGWPWPPLRWRC